MRLKSYQMDFMENEMPLHEQATALLRANGYTWSGRPREEIDIGQCQFNSSIIYHSNGGWLSRQGRHK